MIERFDQDTLARTLDKYAEQLVTEAIETGDAEAPRQQLLAAIHDFARRLDTALGKARVRHGVDDRCPWHTELDRLSTELQRILW